MNERLQRKCLFVSVAMHALLVLIVVVASAFKGKVKEPDLKPMTIIDANVINRLLLAPATPTVAPPTQPAQPVSSPAPQPPKVEPEPPVPTPPKKVEPPKPVKQPDPPKTQPKPVEKKPDPKPAPKRTPKKPEKKPPPKKPTPRTPPKVNTSALLNKLNNRPDPAAERRERERAEQQRKEARAAETRRMAALKSKLSRASTLNTSKSVTISSGSAARAAVDYGNYVKLTYDRHWREPSGLSKGLFATITVTIRRDGSVKSARVSKPSGVAQFDNALQALANTVRSFRDFPSGMTASEETFSIGFEIE